MVLDSPSGPGCKLGFHCPRRGTDFGRGRASQAAMDLGQLVFQILAQRRNRALPALCNCDERSAKGLYRRFGERIAITLNMFFKRDQRKFPRCLIGRTAQNLSESYVKISLLA
jgi:hypothetical protein